MQVLKSTDEIYDESVIAQRLDRVQMHTPLVFIILELSMLYSFVILCEWSSPRILGCNMSDGAG